MKQQEKQIDVIICLDERTIKHKTISLISSAITVYYYSVHQQHYMFSEAAAFFTPAAITAKNTLGKKDLA